MIDDTIIELTDQVGIGIGAACTAVGRPRATHHRRTRRPHGPPAPPASRKGQRQPRALTPDERAETLSELRDERFVDQAPASVYATLLDENRYLCSISTMYRLLREQGETGERRRQATHPPKVKPELAASGPNQVYSWDITKLLGPAKWTYYYLYVIIDIYSRYVPAGCSPTARARHWPNSCWPTLLQAESTTIATSRFTPSSRTSSMTGSTTTAPPAYAPTGC
jgi:putative transposase